MRRQQKIRRFHRAHLTRIGSDCNFGCPYEASQNAINPAGLFRSCFDSDHGAAGVFWNAALARQPIGIAHCRASQSPGHDRSRVAAGCGTGARFASARSIGRLESDRCRESGAAVSPPYVSGSRPQTPIAPLARKAIHPAVDRAAQSDGVRRFAESCSTIAPDSAGHRPGCRYR